jgi:hypothetical protein
LRKFQGLVWSKAGVFIGPQILFRHCQFDLILTDDRKAAWNAFQHDETGFLGNVKAVDISKLIKNLVTPYENFGCNMSLKMHFLHSHLDPFPVNCGALSDKHSEHFHQDISAMENRYKGKWSAAILASYCWMVKMDALEIQYSNKRKGTSFNSCNFTVMSCFHIST